jgi:putative aldouronate transport system permease protein
MKTIRSNLVDVFLLVFLGLIALICVFPFYQTLVLSFSNASDTVDGRILLFPSELNLSAYKYLIEDGKAARGFNITLWVTVFGTLLSMVITASGAYGLTKKTLPGYGFIFNAIIFTMFFGGGLVPFYLVVRGLGMLNSFLAMVIPSAVSTFNLILMKNFFASIPMELEESAKIDGANEILILVRIIIPVSLPIIATIALFYSVGYWNTWYNSMLFIQDVKKYPLQLILRQMITNLSALVNDKAYEQAVENMTMYQESVKAAVIMISAIPILMVYPFLQKYFAKGIMLGSIKG